MSIPTEEFSQFQGTGTVTSDEAFLSYLGGNQNNLSNVLSTNENNYENHELQIKGKGMFLYSVVSGP